MSNVPTWVWVIVILGVIALPLKIKVWKNLLSRKRDE